MNSWTRVIIEWANCLGIVDSNIESIQDLKDGAFYEKLVLQLCRGNEENLIDTTTTQDERELVSKFIQAEYPDFGSIDCTLEIPAELYTASLLLVQCSQQPMFHRPMCVALKHETQIQIKRFLEMVLPAGKCLTKESVGAAIVELEDTISTDASSTPIIRPLREFFNSPAVKSARSQRFMNDRNRELLWLRAQLETEQFEKADLVEDLKNLNDKVDYLQKKLDDKTRELRELRLDRLRPPTPQSCRKVKRPSDNEERYRRDAESLEIENSRLMSEIEKLRDERDEVAHRLTSSEKFNLAIQEKYETSEKTVECLANQLEAQNKEILDLRINSEQLREQIRQMQRLSLGEQSFDMEPICDEALSSIVDLQLQEARKEATQLKNELAELKRQLEESQRNCEALRDLEVTLRDRTLELDTIRSSFRAVEEQLSSSDARAMDLVLEKSRLTEKLTELGACLREKNELLALTEQRKSKLESDLEIVNSRVHDLQSSLANEESRTLELKSTVEIAKRETEDLRKVLLSTKEHLLLVEGEKENLASTLDETTLKLRDSIISLTNEQTLTKNLQVTLATFKAKSEELERRLSLSEEQNVFVNENKKLLESKYEAMMKKFETTECCLNDERALVENLKSTLVKANEDNEAMKTLIESKEELLNNEKTKVAELQATVQRGRSDHESTQVMLDEVKITLQTEKEESGRLRQIVLDLKKTSQGLESLLRSKEEHLEESAKRETSLEKELESCQLKSNDLKELLLTERARSGELESQLLRATKSCEELEEKLVSKDRVLTETEISRKNLEAMLNDANKRIIEIGSNLENLNMELVKVEEEKRKSTLANEKLEEYARAADEKIVGVETKIFSYEKRIKDLNESIAAKTENFEKIQHELRQKNTLLDSLSQRLIEAEKRETTTADCLRVSEKKVSELSELREEMTNQIKQAIETSETLRRENEALEGKVSDYVLSTNNLERQIIEHKNKLDESRKNLQQEISLREELAQKFERSSRTNKELEEKLRLKENDYTIALNERESLDEKFTSCVSEISVMRQTIESLKREIESSHETIREESSRSKELKEQVQDLRTTSAELAAELSLKNNELTNHQRERDSAKLELASYVSETSNLKEQVESMQQELNEYEENLAKVVSSNEELMEKIKDLRSTSKSLEEKLTTETNQLTSALSERDNLKKELDSRVAEISIAKQRVEKLEQELAKSHELLQKESCVSDELRKGLEVLHTKNKEIEENLAQEKDQLTIVLTEKDNLEKEVASYASKTSNMRLQLDNVEKEMKECSLNLQKQIDANSAITKRELESNEMLMQERERVKVLESEIRRLEKELSSFVRTNTDMTEKICVLGRELENARKYNENLQETSQKEVVKLRQQIAQLTAESQGHKEEIRSLENALEAVKFEKERLTEKVAVTSNTIATLEKRLLVAENAREEVKLEDKLKEEALGVVRAKLEQLGKEKIENELRLQEVIVNLQEVRTSQDQVMEAQVQALEEKSRQLVNVERDLDRTKLSLAEKTSELESGQLRLKEVSTELEKLREKSSKESSLVEELQVSLESERSKVRETTETCESLEKAMAEIEGISRVLKVELNSLWDSVRDACPELARPKEEIDTDENAEKVVASFVEDAKTIKKAVSILSEANEALKEHLDSEKETTKKVSQEATKRNLELDERLSSMESELEKRDRYLSLSANRKRNLQGLLSRAVSERDKIDDELGSSMARWKLLEVEAQSFLTTISPDSKEHEQLRSKYNTLKDLLSSFNERRMLNYKNLVNALCRIFFWSETTLQEACNDTLRESNDEFSPETVLSEEIERDEAMRKDLTDVAEKINEFSEFVTTCGQKLKTGTLRASSSNVDKLQTQLDRISKERKEFKDKLDAARVRNAKMEKNMDELRNTNKKLKMDLSEAMTGEERAELERLRALVEKLEEEKSELSTRMNDKGDVNARLETLHNEYAQKLDKIKQKMKMAYNEQVAKLNQEQEKVLKEKMESLRHQTEQQCRKYTEDIAKYKAHISDLSSRYWDVGEKLLAETQEKQAALQQLQRLKGQQQQQEAIAEINEQVTQSRQKSSSLDRREFSSDRATRDSTARAGYRAVEVIEEETTTFSTRRHSVKSIQAMGNAFNAEDEGEVFDSVYLADLKEGRCAPIAPDFNRLSELRMRNSLCRPHLKSSYAVETHLQPVALNEDDIKNGVTGDDIFNDSLSQSLLPGQKPKKKDRTQTSYKRPGPPTPSKNGGRLSLQGNELKSPNSRVLKERNVDRRTTATPRGLKNLFGTSMSKRQDENTAGTPKGRRLSNIFRKQRTERN